LRLHLAIAYLLGSAAASAAPPEVTQMLKSVQGTWKCKGTFDAVISTKAELDGTWIHESLTSPKLKLETYTTYDRQWRRVVLASDGTSVTAISDGMKDMKMDYASESWREHVDASDLRRGLRLVAERSPDKGKTWTQVFELTCRR
jgi:hypothetical protein